MKSPPKEAIVKVSLLVTAALITALTALPATLVHATPNPAPSTYLDYSTRDDVLSGGVKMIPIAT